MNSGSWVMSNFFTYEHSNHNMSLGREKGRLNFQVAGSSKTNKNGHDALFLKGKHISSTEIKI